MPGQRWMMRTTVSLVLVAVLGIWLDTSGTLSDFTSAAVDNRTNTAKLALLSISHSYPNGAGTSTCGMPVSTTSPATATCPGSLVPGTLGSTRTDTITNNGTLGPAGTTATMGLSTCGPRQLANTVGSVNPMLPRNGTVLNWRTGTSSKSTAGAANPLSGSGSVTVAATTTDYTSSTVAAALPMSSAVLNSAGAVGVWFRTTATSGGLFSFDSVSQVPGTSTGTNTYALYLTGGKLGFRRSATASIGTSTGTYNDNTWHYAYVTASVVQLGALGLSTTINVYVDGVTMPVIQSAGVLGLALGPPIVAPATGYWYLGWSQAEGYATTTLSDFTVFTGAATSGATLYGATSQSDYATKAGSAGAQTLWPLNDEGNLVYAGPYPGLGLTADPCTMADITWAATSTRTLAAAVAGIPTAIPAPGVSADYPLVLAKDTTNYNAAYAKGLQIYAPATFTVATTGNGWKTIFSWNQAGTLSPDTNPNASPTFVLA